MASSSVIAHPTEADPHSAAPTADRLRRAIDHAAHLLPAQGPIHVFIHHNTLHAFEHLPFDEAVRKGAEAFGTQPYLTEEKFRAALARGRIRVDHLQAVLGEELGGRGDAPVADLTPVVQLRLAMLEHAQWEGGEQELSWWMTESEALLRFAAEVPAAVRTRLIAETRRWVMRDGRNGRAAPWMKELYRRFPAQSIETWSDATWEAFTLECLWAVCTAGVGKVPPTGPEPAKSASRIRDLIFQAADFDPDLRVNEVLTRFTASFVDQGVSHRPLPDRESGYFRSFLRMYSPGGGPPDAWLRPLRSEARRLLGANTSSIDSVLESLSALGVAEDDWEAFLQDTLLALRGWGGIVREIGQRADRVAHPIPKDTLTEFLAVRLILDRLSAAYAAKELLGEPGPLADVRRSLQARTPPPRPESNRVRAYAVFELAQLLGWPPGRLADLTDGQWRALVHEVERFDSLERRRVFQRAYERKFREQTLDALSLHARRPVTTRPRFQAVTCLDEREESFRRHMEEIAPGCETFGAAGFFNVAIYYRGAADAHFTPLCPIVLTPQHWIEEHVCEGQREAHQKKAKRRKAMAVAHQHFHAGTRSFLGGAVLSAGLGVLASIPLVGRILFPALMGRVGKEIDRTVQPPRETELKLERSAPKGGPAPDAVGYSNDEMAAVAERLLRDIGLTADFARLVFFLGHGSSSLNNPHKSAYDCGACGGSPGAPNGRVLARMLNDPTVRKKIAASGIAIPDDTHFVGGFHNTCDDSVQVFDTDAVPATHRAELAEAELVFGETCERNAHERCRRFMSARLDLTPAEALRHVRNRSEDLAQTRPELGHATNAICVVGRGERTRGLYLDRRAFLTSYDPTQDDENGATLLRLLSAAVPVCAGINLEYYFSHVDSPGYGCGTKLPHNVTSLVGVMDGAASDLRTGLPWQMVEIHEPVRLLFVIETTPEVMLGIMERSPMIRTHVVNGWVQLALLDPDSGAVRVYKDGSFHSYTPTAAQLPAAPSSADWYRGWRDHLEFAVVG